MTAGFRDIDAPPRAIGLTRQTRSSTWSLLRVSFSVLLVTAVACALLWLVWIYGNGLRDPRYLDGWLLAGGMCLQVAFHLTSRLAQLSPRAAARWRRLHIFVGHLLIVAFLSHANFSLPDTELEWALGSCFLLVSLSGILGLYLSWSRKAKHGGDESIGYGQIAARRGELARDVRAAVAKPDPAAAMIALPAPPYDAWIADLYANHLQAFFQKPRNFTGHLVGSQRPLKRLTDEIDSLSHHVDPWSKEKLAAIKSLVVEKDELDSTLVHHVLSRGLLLVHVPVTYALMVLAVLHILVVYAFSSGNW